MKPKTIDGKCAEVLIHCKNILLETLQGNGNLFDILDTLVSDNQCHVHSLLLLNILRKCYKSDDYSYDVNSLSSDDIETLSYAVLLSHLKAAKIDKFNFVVREVSLDSFCNYFNSKAVEKRYIASVKVMLNSESVKFIKTLAKQEVKFILDECSAVRFYSGNQLRLLPLYSTMLTILTYLMENGLPILIVFQRLERKIVGAGFKYRLNSTDILLYKIENGKYCLCDEITASDRMQPTIAFSCFSCIGYGPNDKNYISKYSECFDGSIFPSRIVFENCDIMNLLMMSTFGYQLPKSAYLMLTNGYDNPQTYAEMIYKNNTNHPMKKYYSIHSEFDLDSTNVYEKYISHYNLALNCNSSECTQYCEFVDGSIKRTDRNVFFSLIHVFVSSYENEYCRQNCVEDLLDQIEVYEDFDKESETIETLKKLGLSF